MVSAEKKERGAMDINKVRVLGFGIMGQGIAHNCAQFGFQVMAVDVTEEYIQKGIEVIYI